MSNVDLSSLAVRRDEPHVVRGRPRWWTRYFIPGSLLVGFAILLAWGAQELIFPPRAVTTIRVFTNRGEIQGTSGELFRAAGWIEPRPTAIRVAALAPGVIRRLLVVEDQAVKAGEPIAELIDEDAKLAVQSAAADLRLREAELEIAEASRAAAMTRFEQPVHLQAALAEAEATLAEVETAVQSLPFELRQAEAVRGFAQLDFDRKNSAKDSISRRAVDEAKSQLDSANADVERLTQKNLSLKLQRDSMSNRRDANQQQLKLLANETQAKDEAIAGVKVAAARVEQARVELANVQLQLERMLIRAPVDGRVFRLVSEPGASVGAGQSNSMDSDRSTVVTMYQPESLQVRADVRFENLPLVSLGQRVTIANPAIAQPLPGKVLYVSSQADIQKNTLQVKIAIEAPATLLRPEMLVDATFFGDEKNQSISAAESLRVYAPRQLVMNGPDGNYVWVANQIRQTAEKTPVTTGPVLGDLIEITSGLNAASRLIDSGFETLRDRQRIRIVDRAATNNAVPPVSEPDVSTSKEEQR